MRIRRWLIAFFIILFQSVTVSAALYDDFVEALEPIGAIFTAIFGLQWLNGVPVFVAIKALYIFMFFTLTYSVFQQADPFKGKKKIYIGLSIAISGIVGLAMPAEWFASMTIFMLIVFVLVLYGVLFYIAFKWFKIEDADSNEVKAGKYLLRGSVVLFGLFIIHRAIIPLINAAPGGVIFG